MNLTQIECDENGYPSGEWPDTASHLLFDLGFAYSMLYYNERMFKALRNALEGHESEGAEANSELRSRLDAVLAKMDNFREKRLRIRDEVYAAGYLAAAKLDTGIK